MRQLCLHQHAAAALQIDMQCRGDHCRFFCRTASKESVSVDNKHIGLSQLAQHYGGGNSSD